MLKKVELLAPAGSYDILTAAVNAGCDAAYIGGSMYGARHYADNPDEEKLLEAIDFMHIHGKKLYMTVNTLLKQEELKNLYTYLKPYYCNGLDAVIVQDIGVMHLINSMFPDLPIHLSTQTAIMMAEGAEYLKEIEGISSITRIVPARELSINELAQMKKDSSLELEVFIHGALCYCFSGQCLFSSVIGGRSGNRGRCAQPCRKQYAVGDKKGFYLSPGDMCTLESLPDLIEAGIDSFKIEGRMKSVEYTAGVVSIYRKYIDLYYNYGSDEYKEYISSNRESINQDILILMELYNRGGFNHGYFHSYNGPEMMSVLRPNHSGILVGTVCKTKRDSVKISLNQDVNEQDILEIRKSETNGRKSLDNYEFTLGSSYKRGSIIETNIKQGLCLNIGQEVFRIHNERLLKKIRYEYIEKNKKIPICGEFTAHKDERIQLKLWTKGQVNNTYSIITEYGDEAVQADNQPAEEERVRGQLSRFGETLFYLDMLSINMNKDIFLSVGKINNLRRSAVSKLKDEIVSSFRRNMIGEDNYRYKIVEKYMKIPKITAVSSTFNQLKTLTGISEINEICYNIDDISSIDINNIAMLTNQCKKTMYIGLPYICRSNVYNLLDMFFNKIRGISIEGMIVRNYEELMLIKKENLKRYKKGIAELKIRYDFNMYSMNTEAVLKKARYTVPVELNKRELKSVTGQNSELIIYGRQPLMISTQCLYKNIKKCYKGTDKENTFLLLNDEYKHSFPVRNFCSFCYNVIYNSDVLCLIQQKADILKLSPEWVRFDFTDEDENEIVQIINSWISNPSKERSGMLTSYKKKYTGGHFNRGVE